MKKFFLADAIPILLIILFTYTATSKFLDYNKFVFQMKLAPLPLMKLLAPILGWLVPTAEIITAIYLGIGFFNSFLKVKGLFFSVVLLFIFELYIVSMLLSGSQLPCTCGGIISTMGWTQHVIFNAFFIISSILSIIYMLKKNTLMFSKTNSGEIKELSHV